MRTGAQLLVVGPAAFKDAVARALPRCAVVAADNLLSAIWTAGHRPFDAVVISLSPEPRLPSALRSLRALAPDLRIVVVAEPAQEPHAHRALAAGADDYVLTPITPEDLAATLRIAPLPPSAAAVPVVPSFQELQELSDVLKGLRDGPQPTLDRLALLVQRAFDATGAAIRIDDLAAAAGDVAAPVFQEPICRGALTVGEITLARRSHGAYASAELERLAHYARLLDVIVAQARERTQWQDLAWRDDLSGLRNRRYFEATLEELIARATPLRQPLTVVLFDIDNFKTYNDRYGHHTGDALIREVATLLTRCSRGSDVVARYGGDEFAIILWDAEKPRVPGSQHPADPTALAERFRDAIHRHSFKCLGPNAPGPLTISGGLACFPWDGKTRSELTNAADAALLAAKRTGKNRIVLANGGAAPPEHDTAPGPQGSAAL